MPSVKIPESRYTIKVHGYTDKGMLRGRNEDYFAYYMPDDAILRGSYGSLFVVSDGVGGHVAGEAASAEATNVLLQEFYFGDRTEKIPSRLEGAFQYAAMHVYDLSSDHSSFTNMQCTLTALLIKNDHFYTAHAGDSKAFLLRDQKLFQLTKDHSLVAKLIRLGFVTPEQARTHPYKNVLLRALGEKPIMPVDIDSGNILPGDIFCLITDGITEHITEEELRQFLQKGNIQNELENLVKEINHRGGHDNMTILTVEIC
jgi:protein phosphatase